MLKNEVERETLALILIVIILVSILGTWSIVRLIEEKQKPKMVDNYNAGSQVSLVIATQSQPIQNAQTQNSRSTTT